MRAGLARIRNAPYEPLPTVYDGLFPDGTYLTRATRPKPPKASGVEDRVDVEG